MLRHCRPPPRCCFGNRTRCRGFVFPSVLCVDAQFGVAFGGYAAVCLLLGQLHSTGPRRVQRDVRNNGASHLPRARPGLRVTSGLTHRTTIMMIAAAHGTCNARRRVLRSIHMCAGRCGLLFLCLFRLGRNCGQAPTLFALRFRAFVPVPPTT